MQEMPVNFDGEPFCFNFINDHVGC